MRSERHIKAGSMGARLYVPGMVKRPEPVVHLAGLTAARSRAEKGEKMPEALEPDLGEDENPEDGEG